MTFYFDSFEHQMRNNYEDTLNSMICRETQSDLVKIAAIVLSQNEAKQWPMEEEDMIKC